MDASNIMNAVERLQLILVSRATGGAADDVEYKKLRAELSRNSLIKGLLPRFLVDCRDLDQFWSYIKFECTSYQERRNYLREQFAPLFEKLESASSSPTETMVSTILAKLDTEHVQQVWERALQRRAEDPDGAITLARTLLESVCKIILDETGTKYSDDSDLPKLYSLTAAQLNLSPSLHSEKLFRQILGGCQAVVEGLGAIRNRFGDAHGRGKVPAGPGPRHAELAVNLAGSMATFLVRTWESQQKKTDQKGK